jgi:hypothetical protein
MQGNTNKLNKTGKLLIAVGELPNHCAQNLAIA